MRARVVILTAVSIIVAGCGPESSPTPAPADAAVDGAELDVSLERPRYLSVRRMVEIIFRNAGDTPMTIETLQLDSAFFDTVDPTPRTFTVAPGQRLDVPVPYGEAICNTSAAPDHTVRLVLEDDHRRALPVRGADETLERLHAEECDQQAIAAAVDIEFTAEWEPVGAANDYTFQTSLVMRRQQPGSTITIESVGGNVIFALLPVDGGGGPVLSLPPGEPTASVPVRVRAARCDPHAVIESKKSFLFPVHVALDGGSAKYVEVEVTGPSRQILQQAMIACAQEASAGDKEES